MHADQHVYRVGRRSVVGMVSTLLLVGGLLIGCDRAADDGTAVVTVWAHQGRESENAALRGIIDAFNAAHAADRLRAEVTFFPDKAYGQKVQATAISGRLPDLLDIDGPYVGPWAAAGLLRPIDDLVTPELRSDLLPSLVAQGTYQDQLYALGAFESALVVYFNRDILAAAGVTPPQTLAEAWSWNDFSAALEQVQPHAQVPLALHLDDQSDEWLTYAFSPLLWSAGGRLIATDGQQVEGVLNSDVNVATLTTWQTLFERGLADARPTNPDPFSGGQAAFDWNGHWMLPHLEQDADLDFGVMPLPRTGADMVVPSGSWCWGVSRDCARPAAAWELLEWLLHPEHGVQPMVAANGAVPGRRSAFAYFPEYEEMPRKLFRAQLEHAAHPRPRTAVYPTLTTAFAQALREIATGAAVRPALDEAAATVARTLERQR